MPSPLASIRWLPLLAALACAEPPPAATPAEPGPSKTVPSRDGAWPYLASRQLSPGRSVVREIPQQRRPALPPLAMEAPQWTGTSSAVNALVSPLVGARFDMTRGQAILDAIEALPPEREALGVTGLTQDELFGDDQGSVPLCEFPHVIAEVPSDDGPTEVRLDVPSGIWLGTPVRDRAPIEPACADALLASAGDLDLALTEGGCTDDDEATFFLAGSDCRTCLQLDGDFARCVSEEACLELPTRRLWAYDGNNQPHLYSRVRAPVLMCAPDLEGQAVLLVPELAEEDPLPGVFENGPYDIICSEQWSPGTDGLTLFCTDSLFGGHALLDVLPSFVLSVAPVGDTGEAHARRIALPSRVTFEDDRSYGLALAFESTIGNVSDDFDQGGWGYDPKVLMPGATDPTDPHSTYARHWLAAIAMKLATTRDGVPVITFDHNRCLSWGPPEPDGSSTCTEMGGWTGLPYDDGVITWWSEVDVYVMPLLTLLSTGLPDPAIPGGVVVEVLGSSTLEDLEGNGCSFPETFVPDRMEMYDSEPAQGGEPYASFDGQTWRFGRDPLDIRLGMLTSQARDFCPGAVAP